MADEGEEPHDMEKYPLWSITFDKGELSIKKARYCIANGQHPNDPVGPHFNDHCLLNAYYANNVEAVGMLLDAGADPNLQFHGVGTLVHWLAGVWSSRTSHLFAGLCWEKGVEWDLHSRDFRGRFASVSDEEKLEYFLLRSGILGTKSQRYTYDYEY